MAAQWRKCPEELARLFVQVTGWAATDSWRVTRRRSKRSRNFCGRGARKRDKTAVAVVALLCGVTVLAANGLAAETNESGRRTLVERVSGTGAERFFRSSHKADFFPLSNHFISQDNATFCGPVSSTIVLNALRSGKREGLPRDRTSIAEDEVVWLPGGVDPFYGEYTPNNGLTDRTKTRLEVLGKPIVFDGEARSDFGLQLRQLAEVLRSHGTQVVTRVVDESAQLETIRRELAANPAAGNDFLLVNYARPALGQKGGGKISPLGACDELRDSFLIVDVNPNRVHWVWVTSEDLVEAMRTFDTIENRGYLLVSEMEQNEG